MKNPFVVGFVTLGVGKIPFAPGTWGSLLGLLAWFAIQPKLFAGLSMIVVVSALGYWAVSQYEQQSQTHDPKEVIIDEVIGMWITLLAFDVTPLSLGLGFVLFRFFDILKPFPIGWLDRRVGGALGTILDDVVAGVFAWIILFGVLTGMGVEVFQ